MILKRIIKDLISVIVLTFLIPKTSAQNKTITHENQQWLQYYNETKLNKNWTLLADAGFRWKDEFNETSQNLKSGDLLDQKQIARDVSNVGHWGNGSYEIKLTDLDDIDYIISLIKQSLRKNKQ